MSETITLSKGADVFDVYVARPAGSPRGGLVLVHEIWGLVEHIRGVADRYAAEGWLVAAPDILSHGGVEPALGAELFAIMNSDDEDARVAAQPRMRDAMTAMRSPDYAVWGVAALRATVDWLVAQPGVEGRVAVTGFCFGGTYAFALAAADDRVRAAVPFYGSAPAAEAIARIQAPVLALYGHHDPSLIEALPGVEQAMADAGVAFESVVYPDSSHAFFNDTGSRYDPDAAADAWRRTLEFLDTHV
ncbi:dienelactone hydrolase family protein [Microbacterium sp. BWT-B31]|uniref:dienelactone hydrolase family protein n=1 Tax=Microbacterium sp. BWT-B31 TaxID=3232072 RepID=UPI0035276AD5